MRDESIWGWRARGRRALRAVAVTVAALLPLVAGTASAQSTGTVGALASCVGAGAARIEPGASAVDLAARLQGLRSVPCRDGRSLLARALAVRALAPRMEALRPTLRPEDTRRIDALARDAGFLTRHDILSVPARQAGARVPVQANPADTCMVAFHAADWPTAVPACAALAAQRNPHGHAAMAALWLQTDPPNPSEALEHAEAAAKAGIRGAQLLTAALLIDATPAQDPLPGAALEWLARAAAQGLPDLMKHVPEGTSVSGIAPLASAIDEDLAIALRARAGGAEARTGILLPLHKDWLTRLWSVPAVQAALKAAGGGQGAGEG